MIPSCRPTGQRRWQTGSADGDDGLPAGPEATTARSRDKLYVDGVEVTILAERVQYYGADGKLVTESFTAFSRKNICARSTARWTSF